MSSMVLIMFLVSAEEFLISSIALMRFSIFAEVSPSFSAASFVHLLASSASLEFSCIISDTTLMVAASSSTEEACSVAPCDSACAPEETCSEPAATWSAAVLISDMVALSLWLMSRT